MSQTSRSSTKDKKDDEKKRNNSSSQSTDYKRMLMNEQRIAEKMTTPKEPEANDQLTRTPNLTNQQYVNEKRVEKQASTYSATAQKPKPTKEPVSNFTPKEPVSKQVQMNEQRVAAQAANYSVDVHYQNALQSAQEAQTNYKNALKEYNNKYSNTTNPERYLNYARDTANLNALDNRYKKDVDFMMKHYSELKAEPLFKISGNPENTAPYQREIDRKIREMNIYIQNSHGRPDPKVLAEYHTSINRQQKALDSLDSLGIQYDGNRIFQSVVKYNGKQLVPETADRLLSVSKKLTNKNPSHWAGSDIDFLSRLKSADHTHISKIEKEENNSYNIGSRIKNLLNKGWRIPVMSLTNQILQSHSEQSGVERMIASYEAHEDLINQNYRNNAAQDIRNTIITDQKNDKFDNLHYGNDSIKNVGCEIIAVNNALVKTGRETSMADLILETQLLGGAINTPVTAYGEFGSNPYLIDEVLKLNGAKCTEVGIRDMKKKGVYVMSFWNSESEPFDGLHTIAITSDGRGNYQPYNLLETGNDDPINQEEFNSAFAYSFITAYRVE